MNQSHGPSDRIFGPAEYEKRVAHGAALLDRKSPGWTSLVDTRILLLFYGGRCIVGQVFKPASYDEGLKRLGLAQKDASGHGFQGRSYQDTIALTRAWLSLLHARQEPVKLFAQPIILQP